MTKINFLNTASRLYQEPSLEQLSIKMAKQKGYNIRDVPGKGVDEDGNQGSNLGVTRFDRKEIYMPTWLPKALRDYVLGHEAFVEAYGRPNGEEDHAYKEKEYLENLKRDGYMNEYFAGIAAHYIRNKAGNTKPFRWIRKYVDNAVDEYKNSEAFKYHMANIDSVLRNKESPDYKPSTIDRAYAAGQEISKKGIGKYLKDFVVKPLDKIAAKYSPSMEAG